MVSTELFEAVFHNDDLLLMLILAMGPWALLKYRQLTYDLYYHTPDLIEQHLYCMPWATRRTQRIEPTVTAVLNDDLWMLQWLWPDRVKLRRRFLPYRNAGLEPPHVTYDQAVATVAATIPNSQCIHWLLAERGASRFTTQTCNAAALFNNDAMLELLMSAGCPLKREDVVLHAVMGGHFELFKKLVAKWKDAYTVHLFSQFNVSRVIHAAFTTEPSSYSTSLLYVNTGRHVPINTDGKTEILQYGLQELARNADDLLVWYDEADRGLHGIHCGTIGRYNNLEMFKRVVDLGGKWDLDTFKVLIRENQQDMFEYLNDRVQFQDLGQGVPATWWNSNAYEHRARYDREWSELFNLAICKQRLGIAMYMASMTRSVVVRDCKTLTDKLCINLSTDNHLMARAAKTNNPAVLDILLAMFGPIRDNPAWDEKELCEDACRLGHLEALQWLRRYGCRWDRDKCLDVARRYKKRKVAEWIRTEWKPETEEKKQKIEMEKAVREAEPDMAKYLALLSDTMFGDVELQM